MSDTPYLGPTSQPQRWRKPRLQGAFHEGYPKDWKEFAANVLKQLPQAGEPTETSVAKMLGLGGPGVMGILAGRKGAERVGGETLRRFVEGEKASAGGVKGQRLWREFGVAPGVEGKLRWEIPEEGMRLMTALPEGKFTGGELATLLHFPRLFAAYPDLQGLIARLYKLPGEMREQRFGAFSEGYGSVPSGLKVSASSRDLPKTLMHELQHAVQRAENFSRGTNPQMAGTENFAGMGALEAEKLLARLEPLGYAQPELARYARHAGEVEARNVEGRMGSPGLRMFNPALTEDIPREWQILYGVQ